MPKPGKENYSIWLEKTGGIDYTMSHAEGIDRRYFHIFPVPAALINNSCKYLQKAHYLERWNRDLQHAYDFYPEASYVFSAQDLYPCNKN